MPKPSIRNHSIVSGNGNSVALALPSGVLNDDALFSFIVLPAGSAFITTPSGWDFLNEVNLQGSIKARSYRRKANAEPSTYTFPLDSSVDYGAVMIAVKDANMNTPFDGNNSQVNINTSSVVAPALTPESPAFILYFGAVNKSATFNPTGGLTEYLDTILIAGSLSVIVATEQLTSSGATGSRSSTVSVSGNGAGFLLGVRPKLIPIDGPKNRGIMRGICRGFS